MRNLIVATVLNIHITSFRLGEIKKRSVNVDNYALGVTSIHRVIVQKRINIYDSVSSFPKHVDLHNLAEDLHD